MDEKEITETYERMRRCSYCNLGIEKGEHHIRF